ncbi:hypothetical protein C7972_1221 [Arenibacter sp. ARW7G5Y1]|nr:hypothetical protein C7972_1221 [Arenibacter sp. ARW7G5Y1]
MLQLREGVINLRASVRKVSDGLPWTRFFFDSRVGRKYGTDLVLEVINVVDFNIIFMVYSTNCRGHVKVIKEYFSLPFKKVIKRPILLLLYSGHMKSVFLEIVLLLHKSLRIIEYDFSICCFHV